MLATTLGSVLGAIGRSLEEALAMFGATLWALVLGFGISGAVQAFASRAGMQSRLGDHGPASVSRASLYGMVSSSCSYAASAMAKSLVGKGADFVAAMVFMFASTNLVVELGIVLLVLIGWQFLVAQFVGGIVMIVLLVLAGSLWFRGRALAEARARAEATTGEASAPAVGHCAPACHEEVATAAPPTPACHDEPVTTEPAPACHDEQPAGAATALGAASLVAEPAQPGAWQRMRTLAGWSDAARYTLADLTMLRRELVIGFLVAGALSELVPTSVWQAAFFEGHGAWTTLENAFVGPLVAILSFVCSIGNVPLAAALWHGGIGFAGVLSFLFADLVTFPLLLVYRRLYGWRMALRMLGVFWGVMGVAGLATEGLFRLFGAVPAHRGAAPVALGWHLGWTTWLDVVALLAFAGLVVLARRQHRLGGGGAYAIDPVCQMQVEQANAPATATVGGTRFFFCSEHCRDRFQAEPSRFAASPEGASDPREAQVPTPGR